ncbi:MAG: T9SS type A sorting domain-containing protein, partial [Chitinophagaceae bacterium]
GLTEQSYFTQILSDNNNNFYLSTNSLAPASAVNDYKVYVLKSTNEGNSWTNIGPTNFWNPASTGNSIAIDQNGILYIGYSSVVSGINKYKLSKYVASNWVDLFSPLENATNAQLQIFFDNNNVPYLTEYQIAANINKANVYRIESKFLSNGGTRYTQAGGDYFLTASAGCGIDVVSPMATVIQTSATNNWTGNSNTEFNNSNNWSCGRIPNSTDDVLIASGAPRYPILSATNSSNVIIKSLTIESGATVSLNGQSLSLSADLKINGGNLDMSVANSKLVMNGTTKQFIDGIGQLTLNNVTINNSSNVEIMRPVASISGTLEFVNGKLITSGSLLTGNIIGFNSNRFVVLPSSNSTNQLFQNISAGDMKFFPIGNSETSYTPVIISHTANSQRTARIKVYDGLSPMPGTDTSSYVNKRFRFLGDLNTDYNFTFQWNAVDENSAFLRNSCGIITRPSMSQSPFNINTSIDQTGGAAATVVSGNTFSRTINNVQSINSGSSTTIYKDFNITSAPSLLPIQLLSFTAKLMSNKTVAIDWKISATSNPKEFIIEKSNDGILFKSLTTITANNNLHYQYIDGQLAENGKQLYRLKMIDLDGKISYSAIVQVFIPTVNVQIVAIFPSPIQSTNATMTVYAPTNQVYTFIVTDILGKQVQTLQSALTKGENLIQLPTSQLSKGVFFVTGYNQLGKTNTIKIVKD